MSVQKPVQRILDAFVGMADAPGELEALARALQLACELTHADGGISVLLSADGMLSHVHHVGLGEPEVALLLRRSADGPGPVGAVLRDAAPQRLTHGVPPGERDPALVVDAVLGVPVVAGTAPLGALHMTRRPGASAFSVADELVASLVGRQLGAAVASLRLRQEAVRLTGELAVAERVKAQALQQLSAELDPRTAIERILAVARTNLGMDVAYVSRLTGDRQVINHLVGDTTAVPLQRDRETLAANGHCRYVLAGELPPVIPDTRRDPLSAALLGTTKVGIRAYIGVPLELDGLVYGTLCCASSRVEERLGASEHALMQVLGELVAEQLGRAAAREAERMHAVAVLEGYTRPGGLTVLAQPIVDLASGRVVGVEALARFPDHPGSPAEVFALAAELELGTTVELAAVREALQLIPHLPPHAYLSVNAAPATVADPELAHLLAGVAPGRVVLELTEHAAIGDYATLLGQLAALRAQGIRLAVDDTGSGYSSLQHILALAPDVIKLDIALVRGIDHDRARAALARALTHFAADAGALLIAEGIETPAELTALRDLGVGLGQGFFLGRPERVDRLGLDRPRYVGPERRDRRPWFSAPSTVPSPGMPVQRAVGG